MEIIRASSEKQGFAVLFQEAYVQNQVQLAIRSTKYNVHDFFQETNLYFILRT